MDTSKSEQRGKGNGVQRAKETAEHAQEKLQKTAQDGGKRLVDLFKERPATGALAAGCAAFVVASAIGAAELIVAVAGGYVAYRYFVNPGQSPFERFLDPSRKSSHSTTT